MLGASPAELHRAAGGGRPAALSHQGSDHSRVITGATSRCEKSSSPPVVCDTRTWAAAARGHAARLSLDACDVAAAARGPAAGMAAASRRICADSARRIGSARTRHPVRRAPRRCTTTPTMSWGRSTSWASSNPSSLACRWARPPIPAHRARLAGLVLADTRAEGYTDEARGNRRKMQALVMGPGRRRRPDVPRLLGETTRRERPQLEDEVRALVEANTAEAIHDALEALSGRRISPDCSATSAVRPSSCGPRRRVDAGAGVGGDARENSRIAPGSHRRGGAPRHAGAARAVLAGAHRVS